MGGCCWENKSLEGGVSVLEKEAQISIPKALCSFQVREAQ